MPGHLGAISLKKSHDIVILSFCNIVWGQANKGYNIEKYIIICQHVRPHLEL